MIRLSSRAAPSRLRLLTLALLCSVHCETRIVDAVDLFPQCCHPRAKIPERFVVAFTIVSGAQYLLAYLRLLVNPKDDASLRRILNVPARDIGKTTLEAVLETARRERLPLLEAVGLLAEGHPGTERPITTREISCRSAFNSFRICWV